MALTIKGNTISTTGGSMTVKGNSASTIQMYGYSVWTKDPEWQTVWTGSQTFSSSGSFTVTGLATGGNVQVTANAIFERYIVYGDYIEYLNTTSGSISRQTLPQTIMGNTASINLTRNGTQILFDFVSYEEYAKGYSIWEIPTSITITEVRRLS